MEQTGGAMKTKAEAAKSADPKELTFPHEVPCGSVVVKIGVYKANGQLTAQYGG